MNTLSNNQVKNTTLELSVNPRYVQDWHFWEALREIIQNGLDANDRGCPLEIIRGNGSAHTVRIRNTGVVLERRTLLLGTTDKRGDSSQRGQFGEGYKLALLVLCRNGVDVQIRTGSEMWTPFIERSTAFDEEVLKVRIETQPKYVNKIEVIIHDVTDSTWDDIQSRLIDIPGMDRTALRDEDVINTGRSRILTNERHRGCVFSRGLFVARLPDAYTWGYDLPNIRLDRDRKMVDPYSFQTEVRDAITRAVEKGKLSSDRVFEVLSTSCGEERLIASAYEWATCDDALSCAVAKAFEATHGPTSIPVTSIQESMDVEHYGFRGYTVTKAVRHLVETHCGRLKERLARMSLEPSNWYGFGDMPNEEKDTLMWAVSLIRDHVPTFSLDNVQVVDFRDANINGVFEPHEHIVRIAKRRLADRVGTISTLVHEVAHMQGHADGSVSHVQTIQRIFAEIVVAQTDFAIANIPAVTERGKSA